MRQARKLLDAAQSPDRGTRMRAALGQGASGARGKYADTLDALIVLLHDRSTAAARKRQGTRGGGRRARHRCDRGREGAGRQKREPAAASPRDCSVKSHRSCDDRPTLACR